MGFFPKELIGLDPDKIEKFDGRDRNHTNPKAFESNTQKMAMAGGMGESIYDTFGKSDKWLKKQQLKDRVNDYLAEERRIMQRKMRKEQEKETRKLNRQQTKGERKERKGKSKGKQKEGQTTMSPTASGTNLMPE